MQTQDISQMCSREIIARRAAQELNNGEVVNLGLGIPTQTANYLPEGINVMFHTENGAFGFGGKPDFLETDCDVTNAGCEPVTFNPGASVMDLTTSLGAMRKGYIDVTILGGLEVDTEGNLANWAVKRNEKWWPGIGGAMDLCYGTQKVIAALTHTEKDGTPKLKQKCTLPLTGRSCVKVIITEKAVFDVKDGYFLLREIAPDHSIQDIQNITDAEIKVVHNLPHMQL
jgi:3-oxoacid CoA-transferase B subunit